MGYNDVCGVCYPPPPPPSDPVCPAKCAAAVSSGNCDPSCDQFTDICGLCIPTCPRKCEEAINTGKCDPSCDAYIDICGECFPVYVPPPPPTTTRAPPPPRPTPPQCPAKCKDAVRSGQCDPSCNQYNDVCGPCVPKCPQKCKDAIRTGNCDLSCSSYNDICGVCTPRTTTTPRPRPRPTEPPAAYLPPPGGRNGGSQALGLRSGGERSFARNSIALPPRSQFSRKANVNQRNHSSQSNQKTHPNRRNKFGRNQRQFNQQPASTSSAQQQNRNPISGRGNWDLFGKLGLISRKG